jgi:xylan 1,4-beta-xylosidase
MRKTILLLILYVIIHSLNAQTLVLPGDYPDPSVAKVGDSYWATATTSNWAPAYPLLQSTDLIHWQMRGHVFPKLPAWADYYFWAPEISYDNGKVYIYYAAHKKNGNLCLGVASADQPQGPYKDHGTLMCEEAGSIDAFPMRDENGKLYMIWKEDGNSVKLPTPIWAMEMDEARTSLMGEKRELFRNDAPWEGNLVEGVSMMRHGEYIYAFYAGAGCCGRGCTYAMGVARAKNLLGPWEKYDRNPLFTGNDQWKCPGHGTPVEKDGRFYLLYHAYHAEDDVYVGRQGLLKEFRFTDDGWIELVKDDAEAPPIPSRLYDEFSGSTLSQHWQWSVFQPVIYKVNNGRLELSALPDKTGAFLAQKILTKRFDASIVVYTGQSKAAAGLAIAGDEKNMISVTVSGNKLQVKKLENGQESVIKEQSVKVKDKIHLRASVRDGKDIVFFYSTDGKTFQQINEKVVDGFYLPPWDRAIRVALTSAGPANARAVFDDFVLDNK